MHKRIMLLILLLAVASSAYILAPTDICGSSQTCQTVIDRWNNATWNDNVDDNIGTAGIAGVRWYNHEADYTLKTDALFPTLNQTTHHFGGVTDEFSNVMVSMAMGTNQQRYELLHNFSLLLRDPNINNLQCWKYYVNGSGTYNSYEDLCVVTDSASDASINILGAMGIACSKQRNATWTNISVDYCADYTAQANAIWGHNTASHGEIKRLSSGAYYLANGFNNQVSSPTNTDAFRPDYYRLHFLYDEALYSGNTTRLTGVLDIMKSFNGSVGTSYIPQGKTGHFASDGFSNYSCDQNCAPPYMDNTDTWRSVLYVGGFYGLYSANLTTYAPLFTHWGVNFVSPYAYSGNLPFEINSSGNGVRQVENSYKTLAMWIPFATGYNASWAENAVDYLVGNKYDPTNEQFYGSAYFGGYYSQYATHSLGFATGLISNQYYTLAVEGEEEEPPVVPTPNATAYNSSDYCANITQGFATLSGKLGLIITVVVASLIVGLLVSLSSTNTGIDINTLFSLAISVIVLAVVISFGFLIVSQSCGVA